MKHCSQLAVATSALLALSSCDGFSTSPTVTQRGVHLASSSSPSEEGETASMPTTATSETNNAAVAQEEPQEEERIYYKILSTDDSPIQKSSAASTSWSPNAPSGAAAAAASNYPTLNGWYPKEGYALWGLPGAIAPTGYFDPLGFAREGTQLNDAKRLRESEIMHCRVAMLACVGYLAGEAFPSPFGIVGPANDQLQQVPAPAFWLLTVSIAAAELYRAKLGWVEPKMAIGSGTLWTLRDSYYPGDLGFDPLGLKPTENYEFQKMQTKELQNGRLAMLGWAGMCVQELVNHRTIGETWDFYQSYFSGASSAAGYY